MEGELIGLIAAMPDEIRPLIKRVEQVRRERAHGFTCFRFSVGSRKCLLIESGMGMQNAAKAADYLLSMVRPKLLINFGFAGAVTPGLTTGDIVLAGRVLFRHDRLLSEQWVIDGGLTEAALMHLPPPGVSFRAVKGAFITGSGIAAKKELSAQLPKDVPFPVLEMETSAIGEVALREGVPLVAIRGISDCHEEELLFTIDEITDRNLKISIPKVLVTVTRKPGMIPQLLRLSRNSKLAGENLATAILILLAEM